MTADMLTVAGRRFRTRADYEAALRDLKKIEQIKRNWIRRIRSRYMNYMQSCRVGASGLKQ